MANLHYYLGPWQFAAPADDLAAWVPPAGTVGSVDLRSIPGVAAADMGFFATTGPLTSVYALLGVGDVREIPVTGAAQDAWEAAVGYRPQGERLLDLLWDQLTSGADPAGDNAPPPLMPTAKGFLELHLGGHSLVRAKRFRLDMPEARPVVEAIRRQYRRLRAAAERGEIPRDHHRRVLDAWGRQLRIKDPEEVLIPADLPRESRLMHATAVGDSFDRVDQTPLGTASSGHLWQQQNNVWKVLSNQARYGLSTANDWARLAFALSSDNQVVRYRLAKFQRTANGMNASVCARFAAGTETFYMFNTAITNSFAGGRRIYSNVGGSLTQLASLLDTIADGDTVMGTANGSSLKLYGNGQLKLSATNVTISGNLMAGIWAGASNSANYVDSDDFYAADLSAGMVPSGLLGSGRYQGAN